VAEGLLGKALLAIDLQGGGALAGKVRAELSAAEAAARGHAGLIGGAILGGLAIGGAAIAGIGIVSTKMAADFQQAMTLIETQAGAPVGEINALKGQVISLAKEVGFGPTSLAQALFHLESLGLRGAKAMDVLRSAAIGAKVGHADLEQTTNALGGILSTHIKGVKDAADAMGQLNAIVGAGNMRMSDLVGAISTGIMPAAATFGLTLKDVGAALATLTDLGTPAEEAATRLRMTFALMGAPSHAAQKNLKDIGINALDLSREMQKPDGLLRAVQMLQKHLSQPLKMNVDKKDIEGVRGQIQAWGVSAKEAEAMISKLGPSASVQAMIIARAFGGGRSSAAIMGLLGNTDRLQEKYAAVAAGSANFGRAWAQTQEDVNFKMDKLKATVEANAVAFGSRLLPIAEKLIPVITDLAERVFAGLNKVLDAMPGIIKTIGPFLEQLKDVTQRVLGAIAEFWRAHGETITDLVKRVFTIIKDIVEFVMLVVQGKWRDAWGKVVDLLKNLGPLLLDAAKLAFSLIWTIDKWLVERIFGLLSALAEAALEGAKAVGRAIVNGIKHGLEAGWHTLLSKLHELAEKLPGPVKSILGIRSPSQVFAEQVGKPIALGIAQGISQNQGPISEAVKVHLTKAEIHQRHLDRLAGKLGLSVGGSPVTAAQLNKEVAKDKSELGVLHEIRDGILNMEKAILNLERNQTFMLNLTGAPGSADAATMRSMLQRMAFLGAAT
jgi:TP901 family phage tail tape measure protein